MTSDPASTLTPIEVRTVEFYGDQITGALVRDGDESTIYVPIRPICRYLGLDWSAQFRRIQRDEILAEAVRFVAITATPQEGGTQELLVPTGYGVREAAERPSHTGSCHMTAWKPEQRG